MKTSTQNIPLGFGKSNRNGVPGAFAHQLLKRAAFLFSCNSFFTGTARNGMNSRQSWRAKQS